MFFRTKSVKGTPLVQLVESFRNAEGLPRQRVVVSLGNVDIPEDQRRLIAKAVERQLCGDAHWFEAGLTQEAAAWVTRITQLAGRSKSATKIAATHLDGVMIDEIETTNVVQLGPQLVALKAWDELGLTDLLTSCGMKSTAIATAQLMISNRLIEPLSEWALIDWAERTALPELLGIRITKSSKDRLYRTSDELMKHRKVLEKKLRDHEQSLFTLQRSVVLYDVTNTHFEGLCAANPKAKHGKNKQKRNDCRQVAIGMAFDEYGLPLAHEVFEGNIADTSTLAAMLDRLDLRDESSPGLKPIVILDAGFASKANLALLKERHYHYLINITRGIRKKYAHFFEKETFQELPGRDADRKVEVKKITDPEDDDSQLVLCRSSQRRLKEVAMISKAEERFLKDLTALQKRIEEGRLKAAAKIERAIGALQKKHPRVQRFYQLDHHPGELRAGRREEDMAEALELCGNYLLKTDRNLEAPELWNLYMTLLRAESGFRMLKGSLGLRPNFHQIEKRVEGHIFISILAYHLLCWVRQRLADAGDPRDWKTLRRLLGTHSLVTTRVPLKDGRIINLRKPTVPDAAQEHVYKLLGIDAKSAYPPRKTEMRKAPTSTTL
jgi:transposase